MSALAAFLVAALVSLVLQPLVIRVLRSRAILDVPGERSSHRRATPRGGGIAVVVGLVVGFAVIVRPSPVFVLTILGFAVLGAVDDVRSLPSSWRLGAQLVLAGGAAFAVLPNLGTSVPTLPAGVLIAGWLILYVNTFNFMDGVNGISALQAIVMGAAFVACGLAVGSGLVTAWAAAVAGAAFAFLPFNARTARVFLGDVGSYGLGAAIALLAVAAIAEGVPAWVAVCVPAIYLGDVLVTLLKRLARRKPLLLAHREHIYQQLARPGRSHLSVAALVSFVSAATAACVIFSWLVDDVIARSILLMTGVGLTAGYLASPLLDARPPRGASHRSRSGVGPQGPASIETLPRASAVRRQEKS